MRVLISGGGTGGHVYPALAVVEALQQRVAPHWLPDQLGQGNASRANPPTPAAAQFSANLQAAHERIPEPTAEVLFVGGSGVEAELVTKAGIPFRSIDTGQLRGKSPLLAARNALRMARGFRQAGNLLRQFRADVCFVTGGYVCAPVVLAASRQHVPVLIYLPDLTPGMAIKTLSRFASSVAVSFDEAAKSFPGKALTTGYPVRRSLWEAAENRDAARAFFELSADVRTMLVFGGSRGAHSINQAVWSALPSLLEHVQIIHATGSQDGRQIQAQLAGVPSHLLSRYHGFAYLHEEMALALAAADFVISRAGASILGEFPAFGLPSILVPYPYAGQHQDANADFLVDRGAAIKIRDADLSTQLTGLTLALLKDATRLETMKQRARALARPLAAHAIADEIRRLASSGKMQ